MLRLPLLLALSTAFLLLAASPASAQWDPANGQWTKDLPDQVRVMSYNIRDGICSSNAKQEGSNNWTALARIVAALKPDLLILQEAGDNDGNNTGPFGDSVNNLTTAIDLFLHGGTDVFNGSVPVTAWVQKYDPAYDLPFVYVSGATDGFNRNVILSRYPFADLNGDGVSSRLDIQSVTADEYAPGGTGGIRGFGFVELDLPDGTYLGDLVLFNAHLKAGGDAQDRADRERAAKNVAYYVDYLLNGAGTGTPDPNNRIFDNPPVTSVLGPNDTVVLGGDWNEDEQTNGRKGPAEWLVQAEFADGQAGSDGTDKDRTDMVYDAATDVFTGSRTTLGNSKLDYVAWQDSLVTGQNAFVFNSFSIPGGGLPPEFTGFPSPSQISAWASDHKPVIVDLDLPTGSPGFVIDAPIPGTANQLNTFGCSNATPGAQVDFYYSKRPGSAAMPGCPGLDSGMRTPTRFGSETADAGGNCSFNLFVPARAQGRTIPIRALMPATCEQSPLRNVTFQ